MIASLALLLLLLSLVAVIALIVAGVKTQQTEGGEDVIKNIYIYLVLFATLMMTIGGSVGAFMAVADIVSPSPYYQSFDEFKDMMGRDPDYGDADEKVPTDQELKDRYDAMVQAENERAINRAQNSLIKSLGWIIIPLPVFIYFQKRLAQKDS